MTSFRSILLAGAAAILGVTAPASAQDTQDSEGAETVQVAPAADVAQSEGGRPKVGDFYVNAGVAATRLHDDNVFSTTSDKNRDWLTVYSGFVRLESDFDEHQLDVYAGADVGRYDTETTEDYEDYFIGADGRYDFSGGDFLFGGFEHAREHEERSSPDEVNGSEPTLYTDTSAYGGFAGALSDADRVRLGITGRKLDFDDTPATGGDINNDDRDRTLIEIGARYSHTLEPGLDLFGQGVVDVRRYDDEFDDNNRQRDSEGFRLGAGASLRFPGDVAAEGFVGVMRQDFDEPAFDAVTTPYAGLNLSAPLDETTLLRLSHARSIDETTIATSSSAVTDVSTLSVDAGLTEHLDAGGYLSFVREDFQEIVGQTDRRDETLQVGVNGRFWFVPYAYVGASYDYISQDSTVAGADYSENLIGVSLGAELNPHQRRTYRLVRGPALPFDGAYGGVQAIQEQFRIDQNGPRQGDAFVFDSEYANWIQGGGLLGGYGRRVFGDYYAGVEMEWSKFVGHWHADQTGGRQESAEKADEYGVALRGGYVVNQDVLFYGRLGLTSADFTQDLLLGDGRRFSEPFQQNGVQVGAGAEAALGSGLSLRFEYVQTSYQGYAFNRGGPGAGAPQRIENFDNTSNQFRLAGVYQFGGWSDSAREARRAERSAQDFDGFYFGGQLGHAQYNSELRGLRDDGAAMRTADHGDVSLQGGPYVGYGVVVGDAIYLGAELDGNYAETEWEFVNTRGRVEKVSREYDAALTLRGGYIVNDAILLYGRVGPAVMNAETGIITVDGSRSDDTDMLPGVRFGGGVETFLDDSWRLRAEYVGTFYEDHDVRFTDGAFSAIDTFENSDGAFRIGIAYHY